MTRFFFLLLLSFFLRCALQVFLKLLLSPDRTTLNLSVGFVCVHVRQRGLRLHQRCCCFFPLPALSEIHCKIFFCVGIVSDLIWRVIYFGISGFKKKTKQKRKEGSSVCSNKDFTIRSEHKQRACAHERLPVVATDDVREVRHERSQSQHAWFGCVHNHDKYWVKIIYHNLLLI